MTRRNSLLPVLLALVLSSASTVAIGAAADTGIALTLSAPQSVDQNNSAALTLTFSNPADVPATDVFADLTLRVAAGMASVSAPGWSCMYAGYNMMGTIHCTTPRIDAHGSSTIVLTANYGQPYLRETLLANIGQAPNGLTSSVTRDAVFFRPFDVTSTADSGPGSLRQVISDVNAQCTSFQVTVPCSISFRLPAPVPTEGWYTIRPQSPLPALTANDLEIDGEAQTAATGDTNPLGPEVFLLGDHAGDTDGLTLQSGGTTVRGLAIGGFARNGILLSGDPMPAQRTLNIQRNFIGVDPTGSRAVPNGSRGINATMIHGEISDNVISGNGRSGIALDNVDSATITNNRIGVAAHNQEAIPNGASGIFFTNTNPFRGVSLEGNDVEFNADFGIAIASNSRVTILDNIVAHNHNQAIDIGLDGPSGGPSSVAPPVIESAVFEPASGETVISGSGLLTGLVSTYQQIVTLYLYANNGPVSEGERFIGSVQTDGSGRFSLRVRSDLRGSWITGTTDYFIDFHDFVNRTASEFSAPRRVDGTARRRIVHQ